MWQHLCTHVPNPSGGTADFGTLEIFHAASAGADARVPGSHPKKKRQIIIPGL